MFSFEFRVVTDSTVGIGLTALFSPKVLCWFSEINILILKYWIGEKEIGFENYFEFWCEGWGCWDGGEEGRRGGGGGGLEREELLLRYHSGDQNLMLF